nr:non-ribosomal peptide synthetase [Streptomyces antimycoticus]
MDCTPLAEAFRCRGETYTYERLDAAANQFAHALLTIGVHRGDRVGVCLERGPALVAALLGTLKAGACYIPLDPEYPVDRLAYMARDSRAHVILAQRDLSDRLVGTGTLVLCVEDMGLEALPTHRPDTVTHPRDLAYLIYTSGSTGRPKGVAIEHRSAAALVHWARSAFTEGELAGILASTSVCFDLSIFEIFGTLACGGRFILVRHALELATCEAQDDVRLVNTVPTAVSELVAADAIPPTVETVAMGGEQLPEALVHRLWELPHVHRILNLYGPSEDTTYSTWADLVRGRTGQPSIGTPLPGTRAYVLDGEMRQVPDGVPGELFLSGVGLARGYFDRPRETADRFVPAPFAPDAGERMYRTGDRVVQEPDGSLTFLGRVDDMVKIRGYRIEPGEVAAVLDAAPGVRQATAASVPGPTGDARLVGYVVPEAADTGQDAAAVLAYARQRLPTYMVPTDLVWLDHLPTTPNGKVDRKALPAPDWSRRPATAARHRVEPENASERLLLDVWHEVLNKKDIGVEDSFFQLGGDSIRGIRMRSLASRRGLTFPLRHIFRHQTIRQLVREGGARLADDTADVPSQPVPEATPDASSSVPFAFSLVSEGDCGRLPEGLEDCYPLSALQLGMAYHTELSGDRTPYHVVTVHQVDGPVDTAALRAALDATAARHPALRTGFDLGHFSEPLQLVWKEAEIPLAVDDLRGLGEAERRARTAAVLSEERSRPFSWTDVPLLRFRALDAGADSFDLVCAHYHGVLDGWSLHLLLDEVLQRYAVQRSGTDEGPGSVWTEPLAHRRFLELELEVQQQGDALEFWRSQLQTAVPTPLGQGLTGRRARPRGSPRCTTSLCRRAWRSACGRQRTNTGYR